MLNLISTQQKREFLERRGYTLEEIDSWIMYTIGHWDEQETRKVWIAYKERPTKLDSDVHTLNGYWGIDVTFNKELIQALLNL